MTVKILCVQAQVDREGERKSGLLAATFRHGGVAEGVGDIRGLRHRSHMGEGDTEPVAAIVRPVPWSSNLGKLSSFGSRARFSVGKDSC